MNGFPHPRVEGTQGSALLVTLVVTLLLGLALASYLKLVQTEHVLTARSQAWNQALVLAEAGVEEALAQLNPAALASNVVGGNGWVLANDHYEPDPPERTLLGGRYAVIYTAEYPPTIYSTGYTTVSASATLLSRVVCATTTNAPLVLTGLSVKEITNPAGYAYTENTYDSDDPAYSDAGQYNPAKAKTSARNNPPVIARSEFPDITPPFDTALPLPTRITNTYDLSGDFYVPGDFTMSDGERIYVAANRKATLYILGNFTMDTEAQIQVAATGQLRIFVAGPRTFLDYVNNQGPPRNFQYYGLPGNTNLTLTQITPALEGTIYAPNATFMVTHDNSLFNFTGALMVGNLVLTRPFNFHFDESLARRGPRRGFVVSSWREL